MAEITIADDDARDQYTVGGTPTTGPYTISFPYFSEDDIKVYVDNTLKTITSDYTISGTAVDDGFSGGTVTFTSNISSVTVTIERDVPIARTSDFPTAGIFNISTLNTTLDKLFAIGQQLETALTRALKRPITSSETYSLNWPDGATTTPAVLKVSSDAGIELGPTTIEIENAQAYATNASNSADAADASATTAANSVAAFANKYTFSTTIAMADPGTSILRFDNATYASVTAIAIDDLTADTNNPDINAYIATWDDSTSTIKGFLHIFEDQNPGNFAIFSVTGLTDNSGWTELAVSHIASNGTIDNTDLIRVQFKRTGDKGETGATGATGATGPTGPAGGGASVGLVLALGG